MASQRSSAQGADGLLWQDEELTDEVNARFLADSSVRYFEAMKAAYDACRATERAIKIACEAQERRDADFWTAEKKKQEKSPV